MADQDTSTCSCGATILWAETPEGEKMPLNLQKTEAGTVTLTTIEAGEPPMAIVLDKHEKENMRRLRAARGETLKLYLTHFADCPHAERYRGAA